MRKQSIPGPLSEEVRPAWDRGSRASPPSLKEIENQAYPQFCFDLLRNSIIHSMWVLANSDEYHLLT